MRIKEYGGAMIKQVRKMNWPQDKEIIMRRTKAPIEHIFNNHEYCDINWCYALQERRDNKQYSPPPSRPFYDKTTNKKILVVR